MKNNRDSLSEFKDFVDVFTGKKEVDTFKTIFSNDGRVHYKNKKESSNHSNEKHKREYDSIIDDFDSAEDFAEEYADDFDSFEEAMDYYEDEKEEDY